MKKRIGSNTLDKFMKRILFEDYTEDIPFPTSPDDQTAVPDVDDTTVPADLPINSSEEMATQLSVQTPPIDDPAYIPSNSTDLSYAAEAISRMVPNDQVEWYYKELHHLLDSAQERAGGVAMEEMETEGEFKDANNIQQERYRVKLKDVLGILIEQSGLVDPLADQMSLDDMASELGYSSASGVRQDLERVLARMGFTADKVSPDDLEALQDFAVRQFINHLHAMDFIDDADVGELTSSPGAVLELDSFRFFFVSGFMLPAFKEIVKNARKRVEAEISKLGVPTRTRQTILNQAFGDTPRSPDKLSKKLMRDASDEGMSPDQATKATARVASAFPMLQKLANIEGDLVSGAMNIWQRSGKAKKEKIITQALSSTADLQGVE